MIAAVHYIFKGENEASLSMSVSYISHNFRYERGRKLPLTPVHGGVLQRSHAVTITGERKRKNLFRT